MELLKLINDYLWAPLVVFVLGFGLYLSIRTRFVQIRLLGDMLRLTLPRKTGNDGLSSFQALALTLSSRVGVGSIAGVATAIAAGGPGSLFWMAVMALLGAAAAFIESTLAQIYKSRVNGQYAGGIPYYIERGLGLRWLACLAAVVAIALYAGFAPGVQSNNISLSLEGSFGISPWTSGVAISSVLAFIIFGNRAKLVRFVEYVVPFMAFGYFLAMLAVVVYHVDHVVPAIKLVFSSAFGMHAVYGAIVGSAVSWGVRRALFATVAGVGEGTYGAAAADVTHPVKQGLVQCFSVYLTILVCLATGVMVVISGAYNVSAPESGFLTQNLPGVTAGPAYAQAALDSVFAGFGGPFVAVSIGLFAFTTLVAFYYIAEINLAYLFNGYQRSATFVLKVVLCGTTLYGAVEKAELIWAIGDVGYASLAWVNMICLALLVKPAQAALQDYDMQRRAGLDPLFDPDALGIEHTACWPKPDTRIAGRSEAKVA